MYTLGGVQTFPRNCLEALWQGFTTSGIYTIQPDAGAPFEVWCDQTTDNGGWTVFQRRQDGSENFRRNRNDYVNGFGRLDGEFWLGLEKIHRLSTWIDFEPRLRVDLEDFDKSKSYATVRFFIDGPPNYVLHVYDYLGNAGNALVYHNGRGFSTFDNDIDGWSSGNCAIRDEGGWWFNSCQHCHLNGGYYFGTRTSSWKGVIWYTWKGADHSLKGSEMKLRPSILSWPWERVNG